MGLLVLLPLLVIIIIIVCGIVRKSKFDKSEYAKQTKSSYFSAQDDKGKWGEYLSYDELRCFETDGGKFLFNCYLPKENGETTEIDMILLHSSGIYVFESKNYGGWIFGSEYQREWTQTFSSRAGVEKHHFYNPVMQNKGHIEQLKNIIGDKYRIKSIIVFSERCELKDIKLFSDDIFVIRREYILYVVSELALMGGVMYSEAEIEALYSKLYPYTQVSDDDKRKHVNRIQSRMYEDDAMEIKGELYCPRCGGLLKIRTAKRGVNAGNQFYGCSNYPNCKYTKNL